MLTINFENKTITHKCTHKENGVEKGCGKEQVFTFEEFAKLKHPITGSYSIICEECPEDSHDSMKCTHCSISEHYNLGVFVHNLELHPYVTPEEFINNVHHWYVNPDKFHEMREKGVMARHHQVNDQQWETNRQYHMLRRILEHNKQYDEVKNEPDWYEEAHTKLSHQDFKKAWRDHEAGKKHILNHIR